MIDACGDKSELGSPFQRLVRIFPTHGAALRLAIATWTLVFIVVIIVVLVGHVKAIPYQAYMTAGQLWRERRPLYDLSNIDGFQYLPQSAAFFSLFTRLGFPWGDVLWRGLGWSGLATGQWRIVRQLAPSHAEAVWLGTTCLTIVPAANTLGNGQANLALAALLLHVTAALLEKHSARASAILSLGFALKPLMLVPLLLVVALYPQTRRRTAIWIVGLALLPAVLAGPAYALQQYADCALKLRSCAQPDRLFEDLQSLLSILHIACSSERFFAIRALCALLVLGACAHIRRHDFEPFATTRIMALAIGYLMLFNPRTLSTSYVMAVGIAAPLALRYALAGRATAATVLLGCVVAWNINHHVVPFVEHWLNAVAGIVFCFLLALEHPHTRPVTRQPEP